MPHLLEPIRDYYLDCFRQSVASARAELDQFTTELLLELPSLKHSEYCYRLYRTDVIGKKDGKSVVRETTVPAREISGALSGIVSLDAPLVWYGVEFEVSGAAPDERSLIDWTSRWIDISDARYRDGEEFQGVVHSVTPPERKDYGFSLSVDFGSAPTSAFDELTEILARDARSVAVGSYFLFRGANEEKA